ncbi:hypothetical protein GCM10009845_03150 [Pedococcus bigeumensis]
MTVAHARHQLLVIAAVSALGLGFIVFGLLQQMIPMLACVVAFGLLLTFSLDESPPGGIERHLTRRPVSSPLDWRVRELGQRANWPVEFAIWVRRVLVALAIVWIALTELRG